MSVLTSARDQKSAEVVDAACVPARPPVRLRLANIRDCRRELARVYCEVRAGDLEPATASRLAYLLQTLANLIRDGELADRLDKLERELSK